MPTPATAHWPPPKSEDEWEDMVLDAMRLRWRDRDAKRNGRRGQRQDGVDVYGRLDGKLGLYGAQSRNRAKLTKREMRDEIVKAETFRPALTKYFFVISGPRDAKLQKLVGSISRAREGDGKFPVDILFFDDITGELANSVELVHVVARLDGQRAASR